MGLNLKSSTDLQSDCMEFRGEAAHLPRMSAKRSKPEIQPPRYRYFFKEWRKHRDMTQAQLAEKMGVSESTVSQMETRKMGFMSDTLEAMADALGCHPGDLLRSNPSPSHGAASEALRTELMREFRRLQPADQERVLMELFQQALQGAKQSA